MAQGRGLLKGGQFSPSGSLLKLDHCIADRSVEVLCRAHPARLPSASTALAGAGAVSWSKQPVASGQIELGLGPQIRYCLMEMFGNQ
jgi:hypothetical protein